MSEKDRITLDEVIASAGRQLRAEFAEIQKCNPHAAERGTEAEETLKEFLRQKLPRRFDVASGMAIGENDQISRQTDVIIYDAMNSPVYRTGSRVQILPRDNVAAVVEVKSKLNKEELRDTASKIADVKRIKATPLCGVDQPVTFSDIITTSVLGCVFAFDSYTSLETLSENLKEINSQQSDTSLWIDLVVVLDKGCISYALQPIFQRDFIGWLAGSSGNDFAVPPLYVHLVQSEFGDRTLNHFFVRLITHLTFFRKISGVDLMTLFRASRFAAQTIQGYQYNLKRELVEAEASHHAGAFQNPKVRFNLYSAQTKKFVDQVCRLTWQDGAVLTFSVSINPMLLFARFLSELKLKGQLLENKCGNATVWTSSVLPISEEKFIEIAENLHPSVTSRRDSADDNPPPLSIES